MTEAAFRAFVTHWPEVAYLKNERLEHVWGNARCLAGLGLSEAEFAGTRAADLFPPEVARNFEAADTEILAGAARADIGDVRVEWDGQTRWIHDTKLPVASASGERMVGGLGVDITERFQAERAASEHAAFERLIADVAAQLTHANADDARATIDELLRSIGEFLEVERAFLFRFSDDWQISGTVALWAAQGISRKSGLSGNLMDISPWLVDQLSAGRAVDAGVGLFGRASIPRRSSIACA
jgi:PAS domain S-box-containing protein